MVTTTIVIPTRHEERNIEQLTKRLADTLPDGSQVLFVDDSDDRATVEAIIDASYTLGGRVDINYIYRDPSQRTNGLCGAVLEGINNADSDLVLVMDGDLQHPPETVPKLIATVRQVDMAIASRYCPGGNAEGLNGRYRRIVSLVSTWAAKLLFPVALHGVTDPMTGFFVVRRDKLDLERMSAADGFKVLLEILVQHPRLHRCEVPVQFASRHDGESNGDLRQGLCYLLQLARLRTVCRPSFPTVRRLIRGNA